MINVMSSVNKPMNEVERCLDSQLWHACAGGMVQMPSVNSKAFYFPQGHAEHAQKALDFGGFPRIPPLVLCRVSSIRYLADFETDEVYAKIRLVPLKGNECDVVDNDGGIPGFDNKDENQEKPNSFAKTLTQSDANNGGGFSVPRYCAETIFPLLDYSAEPPVQTILAKDVHGETWKFRHIYRGTPRRHLLTTGWSNFVNQKKLVAGDSIVFLRAENGELFVGIRRAKRGIGSGPEATSGWNTGAGTYTSSLYQGFSGFFSDDEKKFMRNGQGGSNCDEGLRNRSKVRAESVAEAATLAANSQPFEVVYYPRACTPEFVLKASAVRAAMRIQWCSGMRFKMPFETEDSSRISWFMGTISSVQVDDPIHWPNSPWRLLQVAWDEPDLLQNVKRVNPWLVELVANMPPIHLSPFSPPRKKLRLPQPLEFPNPGHFSVPSLLSNALIPSSPLSCVSDNIPAGIQGARHAQFGLSLADLHFNKLQGAGLFPFGYRECDRTISPKTPPGSLKACSENDDNLSCLLTIGNTSPNLKQKNEKKSQKLMLFGKAILTEQQMSQSCSGETVGSDEAFPWYKDEKSELGHCKAFMESDDVGRTLDLSALSSYEELYRKLASMFGIQRSEMLSNVLYQDIAGSVRHTGDEPFSEFIKTARRLTILSDSSSDNLGR